LIWSLTGAIGLLAGLVTLAPEATLRFLLAVLVLVFSRRTYWELREWRWRKLPPDERFGFANPLFVQAGSSDHSVRSATGASQPQG
jgi:ABC-type molybdate transport system substrate-binding protein